MRNLAILSDSGKIIVKAHKTFDIPNSYGYLDQMAGPTILIHGGASLRRQSLKVQMEILPFLQKICELSYKKLLRGQSATQCCVELVSAMEDFELLNAGRGSAIQGDGKIRMSASLMSGKSENFSGVINVQRVKNPIRLALKLQNEKDKVLAGRPALGWACSKGLMLQSPYTKAARARFTKAQSGSGIGGADTVGAVVIDQARNISAATSTGGKGLEQAGRVSDSATVAATYANKKVGASFTGIGEEIVNSGGSARIAGAIAAKLHLFEVCRQFYRHSRKRNYHFGFIALNEKGQAVIAQTTPYMYWVFKNNNALDSSLSAKKSFHTFY